MCFQAFEFWSNYVPENFLEENDSWHTTVTGGHPSQDELKDVSVCIGYPFSFFLPV